MADPRSWLFSFGRSNPPQPPTKLMLSGRSSAPSTPGSVGVATPAWDVEKDTDNLFRDHTVEDIRKIEEQTRKDIDSRRENLRQMVGEKYRDLIDAADSIVDMQKCSKQVKYSVSTMESLCQKLQQTHFLKGSGGMQGPPARNATLEMAAQLKLLSECPERLWVCLEKQSYLKAAQHFLLARHVYSLGLGAGGRGKGQGSSTLVQKLWQSVSGFKETILECCNRHLQCSDIGEELMVQSLCAMVLLEGCSPRQAFAQFLLARKAAIQSSFLESSQHRTVKSQICHLVKTLLHSLLHIAAIFCQRHSATGKREPSLLLENLLQFSHKDSKGRSSSEVSGWCSDLIGEEQKLLLPSSVAAFRPTLRSTILTEIPAADLHSATQDWITVCAAEVAGRVEKVLQHVNSVKAISSIKTAIHGLLSTSPVAQGDSTEEVAVVGGPTPWAEQWTRVCQLILNKDLNIWATFFQPVLLQRVKLLLEKRFSAAGSHASSQLSNLLNSITSDPASYHADIQCHTQLWKEGSKNGAEGLLELSLKSKSCTPAIHRFCENLGVELTGLMDDVSHYMQSPSTTHPDTPTLSSYRSKQLDAFPFPLYADTAVLQDCIQSLAVDWIRRFVQQVDAKVTKLQLSSEGDGDSPKDQSPQTMDMLLVVGRLCQCLVECCPSLSYLVAGARSHKPSFIYNRSSRMVKPGLQQLRKEVSDSAVSALNLLQERASSIFKLWADWTSSQLTSHLHAHLSSDIQLSSLASSLIWNEISISEEAESGKKVSSVIQVPSQTSTYITALLFALCQEVGHVGGHAMDRGILEHLSAATLMGVVKCYEVLLEDITGRGVAVPQPCALQLWYNLKFVISILALPRDNEEEVSHRVKGVLERLQASVDPFDLDVFMPYMLANLESQLSRSTVLLGVLLAVRGSLHRLHAPSSSSAGRGTGQDKHMVLPVAPMVGRIPNLPMSSKSPQSHVHKVTASAQDIKEASSLLQTITFFHHL